MLISKIQVWGVCVCVCVCFNSEMNVEVLMACTNIEL